MSRERTTAPSATSAVEALRPGPDAGPSLVVQDVSKRWPKADSPLFDGLDLELPLGTAGVIVGRNGAGKTTLLRIIAGMIFPDSGTVQLGGLTPRRHRRTYQRRIGFLSAGSTGLYGRLTVNQHLQYWSRIALVAGAERRTSITGALSRFELEDIADRRANRLSMGQRQRLTLALAFLHHPALVLLDEPWNSLDERGIELVDDIVTEFVAGGGVTLICVPTGHEIQLAGSVLYSLEGGRLEVAG
jgi:heme ABC exporter ATP-binding subunit CcmA